MGGGVLDPARLGSLSKFCSSVLEQEQSDSLPVRFGERVLFLFEEGDSSNSSMDGELYVCSALVIRIFTRRRTIQILMMMMTIITRKMAQPPAIATMVVRSKVFLPVSVYAWGWG